MTGITAALTSTHWFYKWSQIFTDENPLRQNLHFDFLANRFKKKTKITVNVCSHTHHTRKVTVLWSYLSWSLWLKSSPIITMLKSLSRQQRIDILTAAHLFADRYRAKPSLSCTAETNFRLYLFKMKYYSIYLKILFTHFIWCYQTKYCVWHFRSPQSYTAERICFVNHVYFVYFVVFRWMNCAAVAWGHSSSICWDLCVTPLECTGY